MRLSLLFGSAALAGMMLAGAPAAMAQDAGMNMPMKHHRMHRPMMHHKMMMHHRRMMEHHRMKMMHHRMMHRRMNNM